jgi:hypothetical protein
LKGLQRLLQALEGIQGACMVLRSLLRFKFPLLQDSEIQGCRDPGSCDCGTIRLQGAATSEQ